MATKKNTHFKLKNQIGPFIVKNRQAEKEISRILSEYHFQESFKWNYDPQGLLSAIRVKCKLQPFIHDPKPGIKKFANQIEWVENILVDPTADT